MNTRPSTRSTDASTMRAGSPAVLLAMIAVLTAFSFFPTVKYYFAQDDFVLIEKARYDTGAELSRILTTPGQFRPLSKVVYFAAMDSLVGLRAMPYHVVSLLVYVVNVLLVFVLLGRLKVGRFGAITAATLFASNVAFLHIVGWISCIQQLLAMALMLAALITGIDDLNHASAKRRAQSVAAFVLALLCMEQAYAVPVILFAYAATIPAERFNPGAAARRLGPHVAVLVAYLVWVLMVKGIPESGPYAMRFGANVFHNLYTYTGWMYEYWLKISYLAPEGWVPSLSHAVMLFLVVFHIMRHRLHIVMFGLVCFAATILPVVFLSDHRFYLHTYIASIGPVFLLAAAIDDVAREPHSRRPRFAVAALVLVILTSLSLSAVRVRQNEKAVMSEEVPYPRSFVFRRAKIAGQMRDDIARIIPAGRRVDRIDLIYRGQPDAAWNMHNVKTAIGEASALRLFLDNPRLEVAFFTFADPPGKRAPNTQPLIYTDLGECFTIEEMRSRRLPEDE